MILSTPIAVCLAVLGRHVRSLAFLNVLLGDEPVLTPEAHFYQRLLAGDQEESTRIVEEFAKGKESIEVYDSLLIPALRLAEIDRHRGDLDEQQEQTVRDILSAIIDDLGAQNDVPLIAGSEAEEPVVCVPARDMADELSARMLEKALLSRGVKAEALSSRHSARETVEQLTKRPASVICICALPPSALLHTRVMWQQLRALSPKHRIVIGLWDDTPELENVREQLGRIPKEAIATTTKRAIESILALRGGSADGGTANPNGTLATLREDGARNGGKKATALHAAKSP